MIPDNALADLDIQTQSNWTATIGKGVSQFSPVAYGQVCPTPRSDTGRLFFAGGTPYGGVCFGCPPRPILPNTGNVALSVDVMVDSAAQTMAETIEIDPLILVINGKKLNFSHDLSYIEGGKERITNPAGAHIDTGFAPGLLVPGVMHHYDFAMKFAPDGSSGLWVSITRDGVTFPMPAAIAQVEGVETDWKEGAYAQVQPNLANTSGQFSLEIDNLEYRWW